MDILIFIIGALIFIKFYRNWKKLVYLFMLILPFLGFIINNIKQLTPIAPIIHDFVFIIPLYLILILNRNLNLSLDLFPKKIKYFIFLIIGMSLIQCFTISKLENI